MIDFKQEINDLNGKPLTEVVDGETKAVTLGRVSANALLLPFQDEQNLSGDDKVKRFMIATKIWEEKELTTDEISLTKKCIGKAYPPLIVGRTWQLLDPPSVK